MIRKYLGVSRVQFAALKAFIVDFFLGMMEYPLEILMLVLLWDLIFRGTGFDELGGFSYREIVSYFLLQRICSRIIGTFEVSGQVEGDINEGGLLIYLSRPVHYIPFQLASRVPTALLRLVLGLGTFFVAATVLSVPFSFDPFRWILFLLSFAISVFMAFSIDLLFGFSAFWFGRTGTAKFAYSTLVAFISGQMIPISVFPLWLQETSFILPFQYLYYFPLSILYKDVELVVIQGLVIQIIWAMFLGACSIVIWKKGLKVFDAQGG